jgi:hydrogenase-4 component F
MALAMTILPLLLAALAAATPWNRQRPLFLPLAATLHLGMTLASIWPGIFGLALEIPGGAPWLANGASWLASDGSWLASGGSWLASGGSWLASGGSWLALDAPGKLVLLVVSVLYFFCSIYCVGYLKHRSERSNRVFVSCLLGFLGVASLVAWSQHLGLMWVAIEATTLSTAPLIYFNRSKRAIEATWKYLLVGSVGIAMALLGTFFLAYSAIPAGLPPSMNLGEVLASASGLSKPWLRAAFVLLLVGYGTKMGLAPMHSWKPDAYGEAPGVVGAILAGGVTSCAFLAFSRIYRICAQAGEGPYVSRILMVMGLLSMAVAGLFVIGGRDFKRSLAYSSVEHMGILVLGLGIGGPALYGTMLHVATNGMTKGLLFLSAGNIHRAYASKSTDEVRGALRRLPLSASFFLVGFLAITGSPPFGPFVSMLSILGGAFDAGRYLPAALFLVFLLVVFVGMGKTVLQVVQGRAPLEQSTTTAVGAATAVAAPAAPRYRDELLTCLPLFGLLAVVLLLGIWIPEGLDELLREAAACLEARP